MSKTNSDANRHQTDKFDGDTTPVDQEGRMPPEEREDKVLNFLEDHGIALPPKAIYRGLKVQQDITFAYRTVQNILRRLNDEGYVMRCDKDALDEGRIERIPEDTADRRTYYFITDEGRARLPGAKVR
jgi:DNA-binding MarR family transcriptional regulator